MTTIVSIGLSHSTAPMWLLERVAFQTERVPKMLDDLLSRDDISEALVLSTCNRFEVVVAAERFHGAFGDLRNFVSDLTYLPPDEFADSLTMHHDHDAVRHLVEIASGMQSVVIGEHEILGQVKAAWDAAVQHGAAGRSLNLVMRHVVESAKRVRTDTSIGHGITSMSQAAINVASDVLGALADRDVVVVGAGSMGKGVVQFASDEQARITSINRTRDRAASIPHVDRAVGLEHLSSELMSCDVAIFATSADEPLLDVERVDAIMAERGGRQLLVVDISLPRNVAREVALIEGVTVVDMEAIREFVNASIEHRDSELPRARAIVAEQVERFREMVSAREVAPLVVNLRTKAQAVVAEELQKHTAVLAGLDESQRDAVERALNASLNKLLHTPTTVLKSSAGTTRGERLADSARELFDV